MSTRIADSAVSELEAFFLRRNDIINRWGNIIASFQALPGLVGFWPMSSVQRSTGNTYDLSSQGRTLTYNGNPTYNIYNGLVPYIDFDGVGDFLSRADETDLDILGTETIYASTVRGLTVGGWFWFDTAGNSVPMAKAGAAGQASWQFVRSAGSIIFRVSADGTNFFSVTGSSTAENAWYFLVGRFIPSTEISSFVNNTETLNTTLPVASIFNSTGPLNIGATNGTTLLDGRASLCFLCANALPDTITTGLYEQTRLLFGQ